MDIDEGTAIISDSRDGSKSLPTMPEAEHAKGQAIESAAALKVVGVKRATRVNSPSVTSSLAKPT